MDGEGGVTMTKNKPQHLKLKNSGLFFRLRDQACVGTLNTPEWYQLLPHQAYIHFCLRHVHYYSLVSPWLDRCWPFVSISCLSLPVGAQTWLIIFHMLYALSLIGCLCPRLVRRCSFVCTLCTLLFLPVHVVLIIVLSVSVRFIILRVCQHVPVLSLVQVCPRCLYLRQISFKPRMMAICHYSACG